MSDMSVLPVWCEWGFTGQFLRKHALKTIWSDPHQDELLTNNLSDLSGVMGLSIQGAELLKGTFVSCPMLWYVSSSHIHILGLTFLFNFLTASAVVSSMPERVQKPGSTASPPKDRATANQEKVTMPGKTAAQQRAPPAYAVHKGSWWKPGSGSQEKCHDGLKEWLFLAEHRNNSSNTKKFYLSGRLKKSSATPIERRWEDCLLRTTAL